MGESNVFVVRIWRDAEAFRATARAVDHEDTRTFSEPLSLLHFLQAGSESTPVAEKHLPPAVGTPPSVQRGKQ